MSPYFKAKTSSGRVACFCQVLTNITCFIRVKKHSIFFAISVISLKQTEDSFEAMFYPSECHIQWYRHRYRYRSSTDQTSFKVKSKLLINNKNNSGPKI